MLRNTNTRLVFAGLFLGWLTSCSSNPAVADSGGPGSGGSGSGAGGNDASGGSSKGGGGASAGGANAGGKGGTSSTAGGAGNGGAGGTMPPPNGKGDDPNLHVFSWNGHEAAATFTFDDADPTHYDLAAPLLAERGIQATFFVVQDTIEGYGQVSREGFAALRDAGHELANHTKTHAGSSAGNSAEVTSCHEYLETQFGVQASTFAYPNVDITATYKDAAAALYIASRGGGDGAHIPVGPAPSDWHDLPSFFISDPANDDGYLNHPDAAMAALDATLAAKAWRIITIHGIGSGGFYANLSPENFGAILDHLDGKDFWVDTFAHVAGYLRAQHALQGATPEENGSTVSWSWTLPPGFPADVKLRVIVDGGTLSQGGEPLVWNGIEGYYPMDPRALSLSWTP